MIETFSKDYPRFWYWYRHAGDILPHPRKVLFTHISQNPIVAIQANVDPMDLPTATALVSFVQLIGGVLGIAVYGTIFANELAQGLVKDAPGAPFELVRYSVEDIYTLPPDMRASVIRAYDEVGVVIPFHLRRILMFVLIISPWTKYSSLASLVEDWDLLVPS